VTESVAHRVRSHRRFQLPEGSLWERTLCATDVPHSLNNNRYAGFSLSSLNG
jgi:hypothetical protein